jgi:hypothetical protein
VTAAEPAGVAGSSAGAATASEVLVVDIDGLLADAGALGGGFNLADMLAGLAAPAEGAGAAPGGGFNMAGLLAGLGAAPAEGAGAAAAPGAAFNVADMLAELDGGLADD